MPRGNMMTLAMVLALAVGTGPALAEPKLPATPEDHFALAKGYGDKAAAYRKEASDHKKMAAAYRNSPANAPAKSRGSNPTVEKMEKHCAAIIKKAEELAVENEKAADFHNLRGKELQGQ